MKDYTVTITDELNDALEYIVTNGSQNISFGPDVTYGSVQSFLQSIIDAQLRNAVEQINNRKDKDLIAVIKSDATLKADVETKVAELIATRIDTKPILEQPIQDNPVTEQLIVP